MTPDEFVFVDLKTKMVAMGATMEKEYQLDDLVRLAVCLTFSRSELRQSPEKVYQEVKSKWEQNLPNLAAQLAAMK